MERRTRPRPAGFPSTDRPAEFGPLLRHYRRAAGLSQEDLADRSGLSREGISLLERGGRERPYASTVQLLAGALDLTPSEQEHFRAVARRPRRATVGAVTDEAGVVPLVGRLRDLALLQRHLQGTGAPLVLLAGEPGIGKSRLLQEVAGAARDGGWSVLQAGCQRRGGQEPYAPLVAALSGYLATLSRTRQRGELQGCAWLVRLLPELAAGPIAPLPAWVLAPDQERRLMIAAVIRFLTTVARHQARRTGAGALLLLDDLQWAGPDALDLLAALVQAAAGEPGPVPLRIVGAYRDTEVGPDGPVAQALSDLAPAGLLVHQTLQPLTTEEAMALLDHLLPSSERALAAETAHRARLVQRTGGVPFFLLSCAHVLRAQAAASGAVRRDAGTPEVPWDVAQSIRQRVAALPPAAQEILRVAAVAGRSVEPALLLAVRAQPEWEVLAALEMATRARLLQEEERTYHFAHDVIREVLEADLGAAQRMALYRRVAGALEQQREGAPPLDRLAYYYARSDRRDKAALYLERAGDAARQRYANAAATEAYGEAATLLDALGRHLEAAHVREKLGTVLRLCGHHTAALAAIDQAVTAYEAAGALDSVARALAATWLLHAENGTAVEAAQRFQTVVDLLDVDGPHPPSLGLAALYGAQASLLDYSGDYQAVRHAVARGEVLARTLGDPEVRAEAAVKRAMAHLNLVGGADDALQGVWEAVRLGEAAGGMANLAGWHNSIADVHLMRGEVAACRRALHRAEEVEHRQGNLLRYGQTRCMQGVVALYTGDWPQAEGDLRAALGVGRMLGATRLTMEVLVWMGGLCLARGDAAAAGPYLEESAQLAQRSQGLKRRREAARLLAERDLLGGDAPAACARLAPLLDRPGLQESSVTDLLVVLAWATLERGDLMEAERLTAQAITRLRADAYRLTLTDALHVQAMVALRQRAWRTTGAALQEGLSLARRIPYPYAEARLLLVSGQVHLGRGERAAARERLEAAQALCGRLGAQRERGQAEQALSALGREERPRHPDRKRP